MKKQLQILFVLSLCALNHETLHAQHDVRDTWNYKASQWHKFVGNDGDKDVNRKFVVDPVLLKSVGKLHGKIVLDAGSGTGYLSMKLAETAKKVIAVDISDAMIKIAKEHYRKNNVEFEVGDLSNLHNLIPNQSIDVIVSNNVLMDLPDLDATIKEFRRVLKPGGRIAFSILHPCFPWKDSAFDGSRTTFEWKSSYFDTYKTLLPPYSEEFDTDFIVFHRPLSAYINSMLSNEFSLIEFVEPIVSEKHKEEIPLMLFQRLRQVPASLVMVFKKRRS